MKKLTYLFILILTLCIAPSAFADGTVSLNLSQSNSERGNIVFENDVPGYTAEIKSNGSVPYSAVLKYEVKNEADTVVWEKTENVTLAPKAKVVKSVAPAISEYGVFTLSAKITGVFGEAADSKEFGFTARNKIRNSILGVQTHFINFPYIEKKEPTKYITSNMGSSWLRENFRWAAIETATSQYVMPEAYEEYVEEFTSAGNNLIIIADPLNSLYDGGEFPKTKDGIEAFAKYCAYIAKHFEGKVKAIEICNEPDLEAFTIRDITGDEYAKVLKKAYDAVKEVNKEITVIGGSFCSHRSDHNKEFLTQFADEVNKNGGWKNYMDVVSYHPYSANGVYSDEVPQMTFLQNLDYVHEKLGSDVPVWITEYGTSTEDTTGNEVFSDKQQAADLVRTITAAMSEQTIEEFNIYNLREKNNVTNPREQHFGIVKGNYDAKPASVAVSYLNKVLGGAEFTEKYANRGYYSGTELLLQSNRKFDAYKFSKNNADIFVLWGHTGASATLSVDRQGTGAVTYSETADTATVTVPADSIAEIRDMYGNIIEGSQTALSETPVFVICKPGFKITENGEKINVTGVTDKAFTDVTLMAKRRGSLDNSVIALAQTTSDGNGIFNFSLNINEGDAYVLYVAESGEKSAYNQRECAYETAVEYTVNGIKTDNLLNVKAGDVVRATLTVNKITDDSKKLLFIGVIRKENGEFSCADTDNIVWNENSAVANVELTINSASDADLLEFMLWNENLIPVSKKVRFGR